MSLHNIVGRAKEIEFSVSGNVQYRTELPVLLGIHFLQH